IEVYEIDLGLTTILNMYTGPTATKPHVTLDINPDNGTLYVTSELLNNDGNLNKGDLIAFDTSGGSTSSYTTLIEATSLADPSWQAPYGLIYRGLNNPDRRPTILILMMGLTNDTPEPQLEFYLDQTDGNGNLVKRGEPFNLRRGSGGDLDLASRICWVTDAKGGGSIQGLLPNDSYFHPTTSGSGTDSASPPGTPVCNMDGVWADADKDGDLDQDDFAMFQACYTGVDGGILSNPVYCQCFNRDGDTDIDNDDFTPFQDCATGPAIPFDLNNPPVGCIP
ncbi:MAG: hypothetical protein JSV03_06290, partial [Planctomycetota bacterium]